MATHEVTITKPPEGSARWYLAVTPASEIGAAGAMILQEEILRLRRILHTTEEWPVVFHTSSPVSVAWEIDKNAG